MRNPLKRSAEYERIVEHTKKAIRNAKNFDNVEEETYQRGYLDGFPMCLKKSGKTEWHRKYGYIRSNNPKRVYFNREKDEDPHTWIEYDSIETMVEDGWRID